MYNKWHNFFGVSTLKAYLNYTALSTIGMTASGCVTGAFLGAHDFVTEMDFTKKKDDFLQKYRNGTVKEPFFHSSHTRVFGKPASQREIYLLNLMFCTILSSYEGTKLGFKIGIGPITVPVQYVLWPFMQNLCEYAQKQIIKKKMGANESKTKTEDNSPSSPKP